MKLHLPSLMHDSQMSNTTFIPLADHIQVQIKSNTGQGLVFGFAISLPLSAGGSGCRDFEDKEDV